MTSVSQELLLDLYAHVEEPRPWTSVLDRVCADLGVRSAVVQRMARGVDDQINTTWLVRDSYSEDNRALHDEVIADSINPRMRTRHLPAPAHNKAVFCDEDFSGLDGAVGKRFREALRSIGLGNFISGGAQLPGGESVAVVLHRRVDDRKGFDSRERDYVWFLAQHMSRVLALSDRLGEERARSAALASVVDKLRFGVALCDSGGRVLWASDKARDLLATHSALNSHQGRLSCSSPGDRAAMARLFGSGQVADAGATGLSRIAIGSSRGEPLHCVTVPLAARSGSRPEHGGTDGRSEQFALFLSSPSIEPGLDPTALEHLLGLSPAESRVAVAICSGQSVKDYARSRQLSEGTVRVQLKQVLAKTGTSRQADLVRLVFSSLAAEVIPSCT